MQDLDDTNVFVKYLPAEMKEKELVALFSPFGYVISAKVMVDPQTGSSLGYGFVRFESPQEAQQAISKLCGHKVQNKFLMCKLSNSPPMGTSDFLSTNLYLKPLPPNTAEGDLVKIFEKFGHIECAKVMVDKASGKSLQIGFVRFARQEDATTALLAMNGEKLAHDQPALNVRYAETESQRISRKSRNSLHITIPNSHTSNSSSPNNYLVPSSSNSSNFPTNFSDFAAYYSELSPNYSDFSSANFYSTGAVQPAYYYSTPVMYMPVSVPYNYYISVASPVDSYVPVWVPYSYPDQTMTS